MLLKHEVEDIADKGVFYKELQKFVVGSLIYGTSTKNFNKVAEALVRKENVSECIEYLKQTFDQNMINRHYSWSSFPEGIRQIPSKNDYQATLLLYLVEMIRRKGKENRYAENFKITDFTLEHIMPQDFSKWDDVPCFDYNNDGQLVEVIDVVKKNVVRNWKVYSLGNMTLLTGPLNSSISNEVFSIKIDGNDTIEGIRSFVGSLSVAAEIVESFDENPVWDEKKINARTKKLFDDLNSYYRFTSSNVDDNGQIIKDEDNLNE